MCAQRKKSITYSATVEAKKSTFDVQPTILSMSRSTAGEHYLYSSLYLRRAVTTTSAAHVEAHLQVAPVQQFAYGHDVIEQSACQVANRGTKIVVL
jgi:hypothetical protein